MPGMTLFEKIWNRHVIAEESGEVLLYVDRAFIHEGSSHAFAQLAKRGRTVARPDQVFAHTDHYVPTTSRAGGLDSISAPEIRNMVIQLQANAAHHGINLFGFDDPRRGILHIVPPEQGITQPGMFICGADSHTSTHGAFGAIAFGIGASEMMHVLSTQRIWQRKPKTMRINVDGHLGFGVTAKDVILHVIATIGVQGGVGCMLEYAGATFRAMTMEQRMTVCNMSIEGGAKAGFIAPDDKTYAYLKDRPKSPKGADWDKAMRYWETLNSDDGAHFDREIRLDAAKLPPLVTWGTSPEQVISITGRVPVPAEIADEHKRRAAERSLSYMGLNGGEKITDIRLDRVFIGSCTNARIEDLREVARVVEGKQVNSAVNAMIVPGSGLVKEQAEAEGLDKIFKAAGFDWREPGCSMCLAMNPDKLAPGERCASTSNRNFEGRQGYRGRTHLVSPAMAAAAAIAGHFVDVRQWH
jgi:3-isopropylmalate/(R)-2-methylmalate dehydratase large subunit